MAHLLQSVSQSQQKSLLEWSGVLYGGSGI